MDFNKKYALRYLQGVQYLSLCYGYDMPATFYEVGLLYFYGYYINYYLCEPYVILTQYSNVFFSMFPCLTCTVLHSPALNTPGLRTSSQIKVPSKG